MIICLKNKCLLLSVCKNRETIECRILFNYMGEVDGDEKKEVFRFFSNTLQIGSEDRFRYVKKTESRIPPKKYTKWSKFINMRTKYV